MFSNCIIDNDDQRNVTSPTSSDREPAPKVTGRSLVVSVKEEPGELTTPQQRDGEERSVGSEQSSLSPVEDEATTSRLELFQISALTDSYEADLTRSSPAEESMTHAGCGSNLGGHLGCLVAQAINTFVLYVTYICLTLLRLHSYRR